MVQNSKQNMSMTAHTPEAYDASLVAYLDHSIDVIGACINMTPNKAYRLAARVRHSDLLAENERLRAALQHTIAVLTEAGRDGLFTVVQAESILIKAKAALGGGG